MSTAQREKLRIVILTSDGPHHGYLVHALSNRLDVRAVVKEPWAAQVMTLRRRGRWIDFIYARYHTLRRRFLRLDARRRRYFKTSASQPLRRPMVVTVSSINDSRVEVLLRDVAPDVTILMGTSILRNKVLSAAGPVALNIHGGFLPHYRGNHCIFFALYDGRYDRVGSTIHFVDAGVDSGDVVEVVVPEISKKDNAETLYCKAELLAIHRLVQLLEVYEKTGYLPRQQQPAGGRVFRTRDRGPRHDLVLWLRRLRNTNKLLDRVFSAWRRPSKSDSGR